MVWFLPVSAVGVLVAAVVGFVLGWVWYSPMLFGKQWMKAAGVSEKQHAASMKTGMARGIATGFITALVMSFVLAQMVVATSASSVVDGAVIGLLASVGFVLTTLAGGVTREGKPASLFYINAGHSLVTMAVMGAILALWA